MDSTVDSTVDRDRIGAWVTLHAAADRLSISEKTVRRRVKAGQLEGRQVPTQHGPAWQVWVPMTTSTSTVDVQDTVPDRVDQGTHSDLGPAFLELVRLVDRLHDENRALIEAATVWQARADILAHQLELARGELRALQAPPPRDAHQGPVASNLTAEAPDPATGATRPALGPSAVARAAADPAQAERRELVEPGRGVADALVQRG